VTRVNKWLVELDDPVTLNVAGDKSVTYALLQRAGLPTPAYRTFSPSDLGALRSFVDAHPGPYVVKPSSGTGSGLGVTTHIESYRECVKAAALASLYDTDVIVERFVPGEVYRLLFVGGKFVSAVCRRGLRVTGDGTRTLQDLLADEYARRPEIGRFPGWDRDHDLRVTTSMQGLSSTTVPREGERVLVKSVGESYRSVVEVRTIYTHDVTGEIGEPLIEEGRRAAEAVRSDFCGVDFITMDPTVPLREGGGVIGEINTTPGLHHHYRLEGPDPEEPAADVVLRFLEERWRGASPAGEEHA
jgi:cyanophycin synthetase